MGSISKECLSIGIEIETIFKVDTKRCYHGAGFDVDDVQEQVREILEPMLDELAVKHRELPSFGLEVYRDASNIGGSREPQEVGYGEGPQGEDDPDEQPYDPRTFSVQHNFVVGLDPSIQPDPSHSREEYGIEISTPAFTDQVWEKVIPVMMKYMRESGRFKFNETTGLHIHLGKGIENKFSFEEQSNISKAIVIFEKEMSTLHPERVPSTGYGLRYYKLCTENPILKPLSTKQRIELIDSVHDSRKSNEWKSHKLENIMNHPSPSPSNLSAGSEKYYTYNLGSNRKYGTIEFRQAAATLDDDRILQWIDKASLFTLQACKTGKERFLRLADGIQTQDKIDFGASSWEKPRAHIPGLSVPH